MQRKSEKIFQICWLLRNPWDRVVFALDMAQVLGILRENLEIT